MTSNRLVVDVKVRETVNFGGSDDVEVVLTADGCIHAGSVRGTLIGSVPLKKFLGIAAAAERLAKKQEAVRRAIEDA